MCFNNFAFPTFVFFREPQYCWCLKRDHLSFWCLFLCLDTLELIFAQFEAILVAKSIVVHWFFRCFVGLWSCPTHHLSFSICIMAIFTQLAPAALIELRNPQGSNIAKESIIELIEKPEPLQSAIFLPFLCPWESHLSWFLVIIAWRRQRDEGLRLRDNWIHNFTESGKSPPCLTKK